MRATTSISTLLLFVAAVSGQTTTGPVTAWGQCGGNGYSGSSDCTSGYYCSSVNPYYAQCVPGTATATATPTSTTRVPAPVCTANCAKVPYAGINIAGFEFGCSSDGTCNVGGHYDIVRDSNALAQMNYLAGGAGGGGLGLNAFRLPVGWQWLVNSTPGGALNTTRLGEYNKLVQGCLDSGAALCILDIHNYARWDTAIIGQGGPTDAQFASVWAQLATAYKDESRIAFGVMNEPHDVPDIAKWGVSVQAAVTAIRNAGATGQMILLPGNDWTSAAKFIDNGSADVLKAVQNPGGGTEGLVMDVHKYLDHDNSGTNTECVTNNIDDAFAPLAAWLRAEGRQAFLSETGGGNVQSCVKYMCEQLEYLNNNADVYLGWTGWAAGGFAVGYPLAETPTDNGDGTWTDTLLVRECVAGVWV